MPGPAHRHPVDVGVVGPPAARRAHQCVGRSHQVRAFGVLVGESQSGEFARHGHRHADPLGPESADHAGQLLGAALDALIGPVVQAQGTIGAKCSCGERECAIGEPRTAALLDAARLADAVEDTVSLSQFDIRQMLLVVLGKQRRPLLVDGDEVQPVTRLGMLGGMQRIDAGRTDRGGRQPVRNVRVPRRAVARAASPVATSRRSSG